MGFIVPYTTGMRLGQGFNSFTREVCIDDAVTLVPSEPSHETGPDTIAAGSVVPGPSVSTKETTPTKPDAASTNGSVGSVPNPAKSSTLARTVSKIATAAAGLGAESVATPTADLSASANDTNPHPTELVPVKYTPELNQTVVFSSQKVDHVTDILTALNISAYASIKYGTIVGGGSAGYVNEKKVSEADLNYVVNVKVTNESSRTPPKMVFNQIEELEPADFTAVYGDCFVADFLEGGEFSAVISVNTSGSSDKKAVQQSLELQLQTGIPGLSITAGDTLDKSSTTALDNCEVTVSVSWVGGGCIRETTSNWTVEDVIRIANYFPNQCARHSQRTSAVLMNYTSLKSFQSFQATQAKAQKKMIILDYTAATIYARDIFSRYMAWKQNWQLLTSIMADSRSYATLQHTVAIKPLPGMDVSNLDMTPIGTDPLALNLARMECRAGMVECLKEVESLRDNPVGSASVLAADVYMHPGTVNGSKGSPAEKIANATADFPTLAHQFPLVLKARLPRYVGAPVTADENLWKDDNWTPAEGMKILKVASDRENYALSPPVGDQLSEAESKKLKAFSTLGDPDRNLPPPTLVQLAVFGHKHRFGDGVISGDFSHTRRFRASLSSIAVTTKASNSSAAPSTTHAGSASDSKDANYFRTYDAARSGGIVRAEIGHVPGSNCIALVRLFNRADKIVLEWNMYDCIAAGWKPEEKGRIVVTPVAPPVAQAFDNMADGSGDLDGMGQAVSKAAEWELVGFFGMAHLVVQHLGLIWRRV